VGPADDSLHDAARECLGRLFGLFPTTVPPAAADTPWERAVVVDFQGDKTGHFRLDFYGGAHADLVARWVGGPVEDGDGNDVAGELANILCCHVLPALFTARALFHVESPRAHTAPPAASAPPLAVTRLAMPTGWIEARVVLGTA
jgi:hypothetical protein